MPRRRNPHALRLGESSLSRVWRHIEEHDCATISASRDDPFDFDDFVAAAIPDAEKRLSGVLGASQANKKNNRELRDALLALGYGVTAGFGGYMEIDTARQVKVPVREDSSFVVNLNDDPDFFDNIIKLGERYGQDAVMLIPQGGKGVYLHGTNHAEGVGERTELGSIVYGAGDDYFTLINGRPFSTRESRRGKRIRGRFFIEGRGTFLYWDKLQPRTKWLVERNAKPALRESGISTHRARIL